MNQFNWKINMCKLFLSILILGLCGAVHALDLHCVLDKNTPNAFSKHIPNASLEILIKINNSKVTMFSNEKILTSKKEAMTYEIDFTENASASINRETLRLIYFTSSMERAGNLGGYYGNSREPGADYNCRLLIPKI